MTSIGPGDAGYAAAMREAKAQFEAAMAKGAMKGRGRPAAQKPASAPVVDVVDVADDDILAEIEGVTAEEPAAEEPAAAAAPAPEPEPEPDPAPAAKPAKRARPAAKTGAKSGAKTAAKPAAKSGAKTGAKAAARKR
jgi:hypothetical protein